MAGERLEELKKRVEKQAKTLGSLASSLKGIGEIGELMKRVEKPCEALSGLAAGFGEKFGGDIGGLDLFWFG